MSYLPSANFPNWKGTSKSRPRLSQIHGADDDEIKQIIAEILAIQSYVVTLKNLFSEVEPIEVEPIDTEFGFSLIQWNKVGVVLLPTSDPFDTEDLKQLLYMARI